MLEQINEFSKDLIPEVCEIIKGHRSNSKPATIQAQILHDADKMDAFSELGIARGLMMRSQKGFSLQNAVQDYLKLIDRYYQNLSLKIAQDITKKDFIKAKDFLRNIVELYDYKSFL